MNSTSIETSQELEVRNAWEEFVKHFKLIFYNNLSKKDLTMSFSWELEYKAIGEIGGRLLEDFFVSKLEEENNKQDFIIFEPVHARALGDVKCIFKHYQKEFIFYIDIKCNYLRMRERTFEYYQKKGIKKKKPGQSHPNIMSVEKLKTFVEDDEHINSDIAMLFIKYDIDKTNQSFEFKIDPQLEQKCLFLLRDIGDDYFDVGNLGKGQVQMSKLDRLEFTTRGKREFLDIVLQKRQKDRIKRPTKI